MYRPMIPSSVRRFENENEQIRIILKKISIYPDQPNYGIFSRKNSTIAKSESDSYSDTDTTK